MFPCTGKAGRRPQRSAACGDDLSQPERGDVDGTEGAGGKEKQRGRATARDHENENEKPRTDGSSTVSGPGDCKVGTGRKLLSRRTCSI